jgi:hypothetical protein
LLKSHFRMQIIVLTLWKLGQRTGSTIYLYLVAIRIRQCGIDCCIVVWFIIFVF